MKGRLGDMLSVALGQRSHLRRAARLGRLQHVTAVRPTRDRSQAVDPLFQVYFFTRGKVKPANKQYAKVHNDYDITMDVR